RPSCDSPRGTNRFARHTRGRVRHDQAIPGRGTPGGARTGPTGRVGGAVRRRFVPLRPVAPAPAARGGGGRAGDGPGSPRRSRTVRGAPGPAALAPGGDR